jgi:polyhydroxybutyrate depolymerase
MVLHGYGSKDVPVIKYGFNPVADKEGFAICYPHGPKDDNNKIYWSIGYKYHIQTGQMRDDVGFLVRLIKHLQKNYNLSKENVFSAGNSNGGAMGYILAYKKPEKFAAIASVSGHIMEYMYRRLEPKKPIPIMEIHGTHDALARWNGDPFNNDLRGGDIAIPRVVGLWAAANRCTYEVTEELPQIRNKVIVHKYKGGTNGNEVWLYEVVNGKHSYAENDMNTAAEIWKFFSMYLK